MKDKQQSSKKASFPLYFSKLKWPNTLKKEGNVITIPSPSPPLTYAEEERKQNPYSLEDFGEQILTTEALHYCSLNRGISGVSKNLFPSGLSLKTQLLKAQRCSQHKKNNPELNCRVCCWRYRQQASKLASVENERIWQNYCFQGPGAGSCFKSTSHHQRPAGGSWVSQMNTLGRSESCF